MKADRLVALHREAWGAAPTVDVGAPGRVNLVGDHTDYAHLPVLPVAIHRTIRVLAGPGDRGFVRGLSTSAGGFLRFPVGASPDQLTGWGVYVAAALRQLDVPDRGLVLTIGGDLPSTGGLSSSSALTLGVLAAVGTLSGEFPPQASLVDLAIASERSLGVEGGAMDQIVIVYAESGSALRIDFSPPARRAVPIPGGIRVIVGSSGTVAAKAGSARDGYNRLARTAGAVAQLAIHAFGLDEEPTRALGDLQVDRGELSAWAAELAGSAPDVSAGEGRLDLGVMARHLISEARRVDDMEQALVDGDLGGSGRVMSASQRSMRSIGVVTPALELVTEAMLDAGADGARVTGAGFGGYAVSVCAPQRVAAVIDAAVAATGGPAFEVRPSGGIRRG